MIIERAGIENAEEILDLQKEAYLSEAEVYKDFTIPPLTQTLDEIRDDFGDQLFLKAVVDGEIVGSVRACMDERICNIGRLIVRPGFQNRGIGTGLMDEIERRFGEADRFELFTGHRSEGPIHIYEKRGYEVFRTRRVHDDLTLVFMQK